VAAALDDVARRVALAEPRRDERAAHDRHADLAAVQVAGDRERDPFGHGREEVGVVAEDDHRRAGRHVAQGAGRVGRAVARVLEARDPDAAGVARLVLEHGDPGGPQGGAHARAVVVPVVVAEDGDDAARGPEGGEAGRDGPRRHGRPEAHLGVDVVAEQQDEIGPARVDGVDEALEAILADVRRARVEVGDQRDAQPCERVRPAGECEVALADDAAARFVPQRPPGDGGGRGRDGARGGGCARTRHAAAG
jgi:hypothetical protein